MTGPAASRAVPLTLSLLWLLACALAFSNSAVALLELLGMSAAALLWMLLYGGRLAWHFAQRRRGNRRADRAHRHWRYWCVEPAVLALGAALSGSGAFAQGRLLLSEPALLAYVQAVREGRVDIDQEFGHAPRWVGLYCVTRTEALPDGSVRMITGQAGLMDQAGLAHATQAAPQRRGEDSYRPLHGHWWAWRESW